VSPGVRIQGVAPTRDVQSIRTPQSQILGYAGAGQPHLRGALELATNQVVMCSNILHLSLHEARVTFSHRLTR
jgi:hypothetical protein